MHEDSGLEYGNYPMLDAVWLAVQITVWSLAAWKLVDLIGTYIPDSSR